MADYVSFDSDEPTTLDGVKLTEVTPDSIPAGVFRVPSFFVLRLNANNKPTFADAFIMEDASFIIVDDPNGWTFQSPSVEISRRAQITATASRGANAPHQTHVPAQERPCFSGHDEQAAVGLAGGRGGNGKPLNFTWGIESVGRLTIVTSGAPGGNGGNGGAGQQGGGADCVRCDGKGGGKGGDGGPAGAGGDAGQITLRWFPADDFKDADALMKEVGKLNQVDAVDDQGNPVKAFAVAPQGIILFSDGGAPGVPGAGGPGGRGGDGINCIFYSRGGGARGATGAPGGPGRNGQSKTPQVALIPKP